MEKIFTVLVGSFSGVERTDFGYEYEVDGDTTRNITCIKDGDEMVDIVSFDRYYSLKREENGTLAKSEYKIIKFNEEYAISSYGYNPKNQKARDVLKIHLEATKARCLITKAQKQLKKTK